MTSIQRPEPAFDEAEADRRLLADRGDAVAMLAKADNRIAAGDYRAANAYYGQVARLAEAGRPVAHGDVLRARTALAWLADHFRAAVIDGLGRRGITPGTMHPRFAKSLAIMLGERQRDPVRERFPQLPKAYFYPDLPYLQFDDPVRHPWVPEIEAATDAICAEARSLLEGAGDFAPYVKTSTDRPQGDVHGMLENASWSTLELTIKGAPDPRNVELCPSAYATLDRHAPLCRIPNRAPSMTFSLLKARSRIPPHTGVMNARLICHLPLVVPGRGALRVGEIEQAWTYGRIVLFDDTVEHEAWNDAEEDRLVLIFDVWRPELEPVEREQISALFEIVDSA